MICIVKTSKIFHTILLTQQLKTLTKYKNLTCKNFNTYCVLGWRLIREDFITEIEYIQSKQTIGSDKLSRFPNNGNQYTTQESMYTTETMSELHDIKELSDGTFPKELKLIYHYHWEEPFLTKKLKRATY